MKVFVGIMAVYLAVFGLLVGASYLWSGSGPVKGAEVTCLD